MLGYRCCSDLDRLPEAEFEQLLAGRTDRVFDAYVNIGSLTAKARTVRERYPRAKFIITTSQAGTSDGSYLDILDCISGSDIAILDSDAVNKWQVVCKHLNVLRPFVPFPRLQILDRDDSWMRTPNQA